MTADTAARGSVADDHSSRIVVGVDGSPSSVETLRWAGHLAGPLRCGIDAVCAWQIPMSYSMAAGMDDDSEIEALKVIDRAAGDAFGDHLPNDLRSHVRQGHPAQVLLKFSADTHADMLIVGSRGHGGFVGMLLGSTSAYCVEHASCAVLVVHGNSGRDGSPR